MIRRWRRLKPSPPFPRRTDLAAMTKGPRFHRAFLRPPAQTWPPEVGQPAAAGGKVQAVLRTVREYSSASSIHGLSYIFEAGQPAGPRSLWAAVVSVAVGLAALLSLQGF